MLHDSDGIAGSLASTSGKPTSSLRESCQFRYCYFFPREQEQSRSEILFRRWLPPSSSGGKMQDEKSRLLRANSRALRKAFAEVRHLRTMVRRAELRSGSRLPSAEQTIIGSNEELKRLVFSVALPRPLTVDRIKGAGHGQRQRQTQQTGKEAEIRQAEGFGFGVSARQS
jgi:hypothetical protein